MIEIDTINMDSDIVLQTVGKNNCFKASREVGMEILFS